MKRLFVMTLVMVSILSIRSLPHHAELTGKDKEEATVRYGAYREKQNLPGQHRPEAEELNMACFENISSLRNPNCPTQARYGKSKYLVYIRDKHKNDVPDKGQYKIEKEFQADVSTALKAGTAS